MIKTTEAKKVKSLSTVVFNYISFNDKNPFYLNLKHFRKTKVISSRS
ncbi:hypothetical protein SDC9_123711 [bioreactor metagenome]|uniref:Uncharacterized protein n=1 Tax=bioreactor metagenome TaxID=1076179 RepID=A0A645CIW2_9ZZZZ